MVDLNTRIDSRLGWELDAAAAINDAGQIVGSGRHHGKARAFLLTEKQAQGAMRNARIKTGPVSKRCALRVVRCAPRSGYPFRSAGFSFRSERVNSGMVKTVGPALERA